MPVPVWPETLPQRFLRDGYTEEPMDNAVRSNPDAGRQKSRRRFTVEIIRVRGTMYMTTEQYETLMAFYKSDVLSTLPFDFPKPAVSAEETVEVVFTARPTRRAARSPGRWLVDLALEWVE